jgi:hypothetical protein
MKKGGFFFVLHAFLGLVVRVLSRSCIELGHFYPIPTTMSTIVNDP